MKIKAIVDDEFLCFIIGISDGFATCLFSDGFIENRLLYRVRIVDKEYLDLFKENNEQ